MIPIEVPCPGGYLAALILWHVLDAFCIDNATGAYHIDPPGPGPLMVHLADKADVSLLILRWC